MSRAGLSADDIRGLTEAIHRLTFAVEQLTVRIEESCGGDWELVEPEHRPPGFEEANLSALHISTGADVGPPKTPAWVLTIADKELKGGTKDSHYRAERAFAAGFWAKAAVDTSTDYTNVTPIALAVKYWIVLRAPGLAEPVVLTSRRDVDRVVGGSRRSVFECFPSKSEILCFCAGAGIPVPGLKKWKGSK